MSFPLRDIRKNPHSMYARVLQAMAQFVVKMIAKLSHIMGPTPILQMARAYGLRPRLWLLPLNSFETKAAVIHNMFSLQEERIIVKLSIG